MMRIVLFGSVTSSLLTLRKLIENNANIVGVFGLSVAKSSNVSGYVDLKSFAEECRLSYWAFDSLKDEFIESKIKTLRPDFIFVIGLSQLIPITLLNIAKYGGVGFHPTDLPKGRGRAPIAWSILNLENGASNFFKLLDGVDNGGIYVKEKFNISEEDDVESVERKILNSMEVALDRWLPKLLSGDIKCIIQDENKASYYEKRFPIDGIIDWSKSASEIVRLIRATSHSYPGAFSYVKDHKIIIWKARVIKNLNIQGVIGRIIKVFEGGFVIQVGDGHLYVEDYEIVDDCGINLVVGSRLGYYEQVEIFKMKMRLIAIENELKLLKKNNQ